MSVIAIVQLENDDAAYLHKMAEELEISLAELCASMLSMVVADDRATEEVRAA